MPFEFDGALAGLRRLELADLRAYRTALDGTQRLCWQHFFPFLHFHYGLSGREALLVEEVGGSLCTYLLREEDGEPYLVLYFLPFPFAPEALAHGLTRVRDFNRRHRAVVYWVDEDDLGLFTRLWDDMRAYPVSRQYLYDPKAYRLLAGKKMRNLRRNLEKVFALDDVEVKDYVADDREDCLRLLAEWATLQRDKYPQIAYRGYTENCLAHAADFPTRDLFGKVVVVDGAIRAFGFGGEIRRGLGSLFVTYADLNVTGLNQFLNYRLLLAMEDQERVNSAMADTPGLVFAKEALRPVGTCGMFRIHVGSDS